MTRLLQAAFAGAAAGLVGVGGVLAGDAHGLARLMMRDPLGYVAFGVLVAAFGGTFAAAAFGGALAGGVRGGMSASDEGEIR